MKVYTKVVISVRTLEVVDEESFDYVGPVAECKKGGGSSGGGGGSGKISFPSYMETWHSTWLDNVAGYMTTAITGNSPYVTALAYDPDTDLAAMDTAITAFNTVVDALDPTVDYVTISDVVKNQVDASMVDTTHIDNQIAAYASVLDAGYDNVVAELQSVSRDNGVVMTSSFAIAQGDLYARRERNLTEFGRKLYVEAERQRNVAIAQGIGSIFQATIQRAQFESDVARLVADTKRMRVIAKGEETRENYEYSELNAKWDLEMTTYGTGMLGAIGGANTSADSGKMSKSTSKLSGGYKGYEQVEDRGTAVSGPSGLTLNELT